MRTTQSLMLLALAAALLGWIPGGGAQDSGNQSVDLEFPDHPVIQDPQFARKERALLETLRAEPDNPRVEIELARLYQAQRFYPQAAALLEEVASRHPEISEAHFYLGQIYGVQKTDPQRSLDELQKAIQLAPDRTEYREEIVNVYYRLQRYPPALRHLEEILMREPDNADALYRKAAILHTQGRAGEAEAIVDRLPHHEHARVLQAIIRQQRGENAKPLYEAILRDYPEDIRARYEYGKILLNEKQLPAAREIFEKIINEDPFYQHALFQLVKIYSFSKETEKARLAKQSLDTINRMGRNQRNFYRSYLRHHPDTAETHEAMGLIYLEIGRGNLAADEFRRVLEFAPKHPEAPFYLAQIFMASDEFREALPYLEQCLAVREDKARLHALMAQCYLELQDAENARRHLDAALQLDPRDPLANRIRELWMKRSEEAGEEKMRQD
ncbi:MAG: tetratricopeptide repeat protein [bacterium]